MYNENECVSGNSTDNKHFFFKNKANVMCKNIVICVHHWGPFCIAAAMQKRALLMYTDNKDQNQPAYLPKSDQSFLCIQNQCIEKTPDLLCTQHKGPFELPVFTLSTGTPYLLTILLLKFETVHSNAF